MLTPLKRNLHVFRVSESSYTIFHDENTDYDGPDEGDKTLSGATTEYNENIIVNESIKKERTSWKYYMDLNAFVLSEGRYTIEIIIETGKNYKKYSNMFLKTINGYSFGTEQFEG